jgi:hypothetical protein
MFEPKNHTYKKDSVFIFNYVGFEGLKKWKYMVCKNHRDSKKIKLIYQYEYRSIHQSRERIFNIIQTKKHL